MGKRSSLWLVFLVLAVSVIAATATYGVLDVKLDDNFKSAPMLIGGGLSSLLLFVTLWLLDREYRRIRFEDAVLRRAQQKAEAAAAAQSARWLKEQKDAQMQARALASQDTCDIRRSYGLPAVQDPVQRALVPNLGPMRDRLLRDWLNDTGEIPWPRTPPVRVV